MVCKCEQSMGLKHVWDTGSSGLHGHSYAQNTYTCDNCGTVAIERVWENPGITWVAPDGTVATADEEE